MRFKRWKLRHRGIVELKWDHVSEIMTVPVYAIPGGLLLPWIEESGPAVTAPKDIKRSVSVPYTRFTVDCELSKFAGTGRSGSESFSALNDEAGGCYRMRCGIDLYTRRNRSDFHMIDEIWAYRKYDYFGYRIAPDDIVVDIVVNIGHSRSRRQRSAAHRVYFVRTISR